MTQSPLVSIIIPVYNHEKYVIESLNSVLNQTYTNLEVIIIDDGSKDLSPDLVEEWIKGIDTKTFAPKFTFLRQENCGAHNTINRGLSLAHGEFLTILNSDDIYHPQRIEKLLNRLQEEEGEIIFSEVIGIDNKGIPLLQGDPWREEYERYYISPITPTIGFLLLHVNLSVTTGNLFFSKALYKKVGEFRNFKLTHDYDFLMRCLLVVEPIFLKEELYFYRVHDTNTIKTLNSHLDNELNQIFREYLLHVSQKPPINLKAPCHWYWPLAFATIRKLIKMDRGLAYYLDEPLQSVSINNNSPVSTLFLSKDTKIKQRITLFTHELSLTGAPKLVADLAKSLKQHGHLVNVVSLFDGPMKKENEKHGISTYFLPYKISQGLSNPTSFKRKCYYLIATALLYFKLGNVFIGNTGVVGRLTLLLSYLRPFRRSIWFIHDSFPPSYFIPSQEQLFHTLLKKATRNPRFEFWFGSNSTRDLWKKSGILGKTMYWSGISNNSTTAKNSKKMTSILSVGTCSPRKGTHYLVEAFIEGVQSNLIDEDVCLTIVGFSQDIKCPYDFTGDLILRIVNSGLKDRIHIVANVDPDELLTYYEKADLYVQSSLIECLPLALLQAMSMGLPIITTDVNGCSEAIEHNMTGYVCPPRSSKLLLKSIVTALNDPERSIRLAEEAKKSFNEKFCLESNLKGVLNAINKKYNHRNAND